MYTWVQEREFIEHDTSIMEGSMYPPPHIEHAPHIEQDTSIMVGCMYPPPHIEHACILLILSTTLP
jgi:hypothetical protein